MHLPDVRFDLKTRIRFETCIQKDIDGIARFVRVEFVNQIGARYHIGARRVPE